MAIDSGVPLDLSSTNLRAFGKSREEITVELSVASGSLSADSTRRVNVDVDENGTLSLTGRRSDIERFLKKSATVTFTPDEAGDADTPPALDFAVIKNGEDVSMDDLIGTPVVATAAGGSGFWNGVWDGIRSGNWDWLTRTEASVDFSDVNLRGLAKGREEISVIIEASKGDLSATSTKRVEVVTLPDGELQLTGRRRDIERFLSQEDSVTYSGPRRGDAPDFSIEVVKDGQPLTVQGLAGIPLEVDIDEDALNGVDLSGLNLKSFGARNEVLVLELEVEDGVLSADSTRRVMVEEISDTTIQLIGRRGDLQRFINDIASVTHTGSELTPDSSGALITVSIIDTDGLTMDQPEDVMVSVINDGIRINLGNAAGLPDGFTANEDEVSYLDFSDLSLRSIGRGRDTMTLEIRVSEGTLNAESTNRITVEGDGTDTLLITGQRRFIERYLDDVEAVSFLSAENVFGEDAAVLSFSAAMGESALGFGSVGIDIMDTADSLTGTSGDDTLIGDNGINTITGLAGNDYLVGEAGNDSLIGNEGDDDIRGGAGADTLEGGAGNDVLLYTYSSAGVIVDLNDDGSGLQSASGGYAEGDVISGFEHVYSSQFGDIVTGDDARNILFGYGGDDVISAMGGDDVVRGGTGADTLDGGDGSDWLRYQASSAGVSIDLSSDANGIQQASGGDAEGDVISNFENVQGSDFGDTLIGSDEANYLMGYAGDDEIRGGAGRDIIRGGTGADSLDGGDDADTLQYIDSAQGVTVSLAADEAGLQRASGGDAEGDVISGFENVYASNSSDSLTGDDARNILYGYAGDDTLEGGGGADVLRGGSGADQFVFRDAPADGNADRIIDFESGSDTLVLDSLVFLALAQGALSATNFLVNATGEAEASDHFVIYDAGTGEVKYDADGSGTDAEALTFATLSGTPLVDETDFFIL